MAWMFSPGRDLGVIICVCLSCSIVSDSLRPQGLYVACQAPLSMEFSSKNTGVGNHFLLQGIFLTWGTNLGLLHCNQILYHWINREWPPYFTEKEAEAPEKRKQKQRLFKTHPVGLSLAASRFSSAVEALVTGKDPRGQKFPGGHCQSGCSEDRSCIFNVRIRGCPENLGVVLGAPGSTPVWGIWGI